MTSKTMLTFEEARELIKNIQMAYYVVAAQKLGISHEVLIPGLLVEFTKDYKRWRIHKSLTPINNSVAMSIASYKNTCNRFLEQNDIPVPKQASARSKGDILEFIEDIGHDKIVVKPRRGFGGAGVSILPQGKEEIEEAYKSAYKKCLSHASPKVLVEEFVTGENYRFLVLEDKVIAATHRIAAFVIGDGKSTVRVLIGTKNRTLRDKGREEIPIDLEAEKALEDLGMTLDSVPEKDQNVRVRFNCNLCTGGSTRECLSEVHQSYKDVAVKATQLIGLKLSGVDIITPDITNPDVKFAINEVNHDPGLRIHYMPDEGEISDVAVPIQQYILDNI